MPRSEILQSDGYELRVERVGPLPIINHFLDRLGVEELLDSFVPTRDRRCRISFAKRLGVVLRSIIVEREPIYRQQETVSTFIPEAFGLSEEEASRLNDDQIGRALDKLFDADRGALLTELVVGLREEFGVCCDELHNDTTSVRFSGQYAKASGRSIRGRRAPWITYGHSKDHRPDLKQLLLVLTTSSDGGVPVQFRHGDGNVNDSRTHAATWETLREVTGRSDFLYVADSKLCSVENMDYIHRRSGRFVTVIPRSRHEDGEFREWIQTHEPSWELVWDRTDPDDEDATQDRWYVHRHHLPSTESWPVIWVWSTMLTQRQGNTRRERIARAIGELEDLQRRLDGPRPRKRDRKQLLQEVDAILRQRRVARYVEVKAKQVQEHKYRQVTGGRPGPDTQYRRVTKKRWRLTWQLDEARIAYDQKSDGMYPLITNDRKLSAAEVLEAHKRQPAIEKRFQQTKSVMGIAPVLLKNEARVEALFFLYYLALVVQALMEREIRRGMAARKIESLPIYPEQRPSTRPTTEQVLRLFSHASWYALSRKRRQLALFVPSLTELQKQVLELLGMPMRKFDVLA